MYILILISLLFTMGENLSADEQISKYPVDVSFLVADLKYSEDRGVAICEVQNGVGSTFNGDIFCNGERGTIVPAVVRWMEGFGKNIWTVGFYISELSLRFAARESNTWIFKNNLEDIKSDKRFKRHAKSMPKNWGRISDYNCFLFLIIFKKSEREKLLKKYPGVILIDRAVYPFACDKFLMSQLFRKHPILEKAKPGWSLYEKKYFPSLADTIASDLQCDRFVIKPRGESMGRGVILVEKSDLDDTLKIILNKNNLLKKHHDESYQYWYSNRDDSFLVEEFVESDPLQVPHLDDQVYDPTMRVAYMLKYEEGEIGIEFLGANWFLPSHALDRTGTLSQKHKGYNENPFYALVDHDLISEVREELDVVMQTLYSQMLICH